VILELQAVATLATAVHVLDPGIAEACRRAEFLLHALREQFLLEVVETASDAEVAVEGTGRLAAVLTAG
jgi:hypothetical protein